MITDPWLRALMLWLPVILGVVMTAIFSSGIARDLPISVVDLDHSRLSRNLIRYYDSSPTLSVNNQPYSVDTGSQELRSGNIYALAVIPANFEKETLLGHSPTVTVFYNTQFVLIGKLINSAIQQSQGTLAATVDTLKNMASGNPTPSLALGLSVPIKNQITPLFNSNSHYGQFLVSATLPALWQVLIVVTTILAIAIESRRAGIVSWLANAPLQNLLLKLMPYTLIFWLHGALMLWLLYGYFSWPMHGSWIILLLSQLLMVLACQSVACLLYFVPFDTTRAMSLAAAFTAPAFAFMGITFPVSDMPILARFWRSLLPVSHYIEVQVQQVNYGASLITAMPSLLSLFCFLAVMLVVTYKMTRLCATVTTQKDKK
ncbi:ABC transporter permease [Aliivibrio sp.]|uniref:ABC transporter permease n=1 Tax=Aliivibrio sp. TaxID=1872443 RepID=UPI003D2F0BAD